MRLFDSFVDWLYERSNKMGSKEEFENTLVVELDAGLVLGLVYGLAAGLVLGLVYGLAAGLVLGLVLGLVYGLVVGLAAGLAYGLAYGFVTGLNVLASVLPEYWLPIIISLLVLTELIFYFSKKQPSKNDYKHKHGVFWFTAKQKRKALLLSMFGIVELVGAYVVGSKAYDYIVENYEEWLPVLKEWLGYFGIAVVIIIVLVGYVWLNSLKYKPVKNKKVSG